MAYGDDAVFVPSAARTTNGDSGAIFIEKGDFISILISTTAASGTPSMTLFVEWSHDDTTFAVSDPVDTYTAAITGTGLVVKQFAVKGTTFRLRWVIAGGTPSLTFSASRYVTS